MREQDFAEFRELRHLLLPLLHHDGEQTLAQLGDVREQRFAVDREFLVRGDLEGDERVARLAQLLVDGRAELFGAFDATGVQPVAECRETGAQVAQHVEMLRVGSLGEAPLEIVRRVRLIARELRDPDGHKQNGRDQDDRDREKDEFGERERHRETRQAIIRPRPRRRCGPRACARVPSGGACGCGSRRA